MTENRPSARPPAPTPRTIEAVATPARSDAAPVHMSRKPGKGSPSWYAFCLAMKGRKSAPAYALSSDTPEAPPAHGDRRDHPSRDPAAFMQKAHGGSRARYDAHWAREAGDMVKKRRIAIVGSGYWGKNLIRNFYEMGALARIVDTNEEALARFRRLYPDIPTSVSLDDALRDEAVEGIVIATLAETHYAIAQRALLAGKHVYVEKPLVLDRAHGEELIALADAHDRVLMVGHLLHYHPAFVALKNMVYSGEFGRIHYIYSNRLNLGKIRREESALWSFAPHDFSMILALASDMPSSVQASGGNFLHKRVTDVTMTNLTFTSGLKAHVFVSWLHPFKEQRLIVVGDRKMAVFDDTLPWEDKLMVYPHEIHWRNSMPIPAKAEGVRVAVRPSEPLRNECLHFLGCMDYKCELITDGREGLRVLRVLVDAQRSLESGGAPVLAHEAPPRTGDTAYARGMQRHVG